MIFCPTPTKLVMATHTVIFRDVFYITESTGSRRARRRQKTENGQSGVRVRGERRTLKELY